jgi:phenylacetate-CoA ligase
MHMPYDSRETRSTAEREADIFTRLASVIEAAMRAPAYAERLRGIDPRTVASREALARLPVLRKSELPELQKADPPFAGFVPAPPSAFGRLFTSPGPIFEPEGRGPDPWGAARALHAMGFATGDVVLNTFSYHLVPGGFMIDSGARALGCVVIPAGPGQTEQQLEVIAAFRPVAYCGTPDFLKIILDAAAKAGRDASCIKKALVSGAAFPKSLQEDIAARGIDAYQAYATADIGVIAHETGARAGMVVNEDLIVEIVRPGTGDPVPEGDVGEVVVTTFNRAYPLIRFGTGDMSAVLAGPSPCGRTNMRIKGWMGRADQRTKVRGMFVDPEQIAEIAKKHPGLGRLRLVIDWVNQADVMTLKVEAPQPSADLEKAMTDTIRTVCKVGGKVEFAALGSLPNDGKVIDDVRKYT